jgi:hypothetical protein
MQFNVTKHYGVYKLALDQRVEFQHLEYKTADSARSSSSSVTVHWRFRFTNLTSNSLKGVERLRQIQKIAIAIYCQNRKQS